MTKNKPGKCGFCRSGDSNNLEIARKMPYFLYGLVDKTGIHRHILDEPMSLEEMQRLVGDEAEKAFIEMVYNQFSDPEIVLICDDSFLIKGFSPTCRTRNGIVLHGQIVIARLVVPEIQDLTDRQFQTVINELLQYVF